MTHQGNTTRLFYLRSHLTRKHHKTAFFVGNFLAERDLSKDPLIADQDWVCKKQRTSESEDDERVKRGTK